MDDDSLYLKTERFGLGDVIVIGWRFFLKDFWKLIAVTAICLFPMFGALAVAIQPALSSLAAGSIPSSSVSSVATLTLLASCGSILLALFLGPLYIGSLGHIVRQRALGQPVGLGGALRFGLSRWGSVFSASFIGGIICCLFSLLLVVPGIIFGVYYTFGFWAAALRGLGGKKALDYSKNLVSGQWWRIFGITAGLSLTEYGLIYILASFLAGPNQNLLLMALYYVLGSFLVCVLYVITVVFFLNVDPEPTPRAASAEPSIPPEVELAASQAQLGEMENTPRSELTPGDANLVGETSTLPPAGPSSEPVNAAPVALAPRNNPAAAALVLAVLVVAAAAGGFLARNRVTSIAIAIAGGLVLICTVVMGIGGLRRAARMEGKGRWPAWGSLGLSLAAVALLAVLIFVPFMKTFSNSDLSLNYTTNWVSADTSKFSSCQNTGCLIVLNNNDSQTQIYLADLKIFSDNSIESLDQQLWSGLQQQGISLELIDTNYMQIDGYSASRRTFSMTINGQTVYSVMGLILTKSTIYQYYSVSQNAASHQAHLAEVDQIIQSIQFKE